jgi:hypothetical protein
VHPIRVIMVPTLGAIIPPAVKPFRIHSFLIHTHHSHVSNSRILSCFSTPFSRGPLSQQLHLVQGTLRSCAPWIPLVTWKEFKQKLRISWMISTETRSEEV